MSSSNIFYQEESVINLLTLGTSVEQNNLGKRWFLQERLETTVLYTNSVPYGFFWEHYSRANVLNELCQDEHFYNY